MSDPRSPQGRRGAGRLEAPGSLPSGIPCLNKTNVHYLTFITLSFVAVFAADYSYLSVPLDCKLLEVRDLGVLTDCGVPSTSQST